MTEHELSPQEQIGEIAPGAAVGSITAAPLFPQPVKAFFECEIPRVTYRKVGAENQWRLFEMDHEVLLGIALRRAEPPENWCAVFHRLPGLVAVRRDAEFEPPPGIREFVDYPRDKWRILLGLDWLLSIKGLDAINLSVSPFSREPFDPEEPLHIATGMASALRVPVVAAAGNDGKEGSDTVQTLARAPWVIAVAATDDEGEILELSAQGSKDVPAPLVANRGAPVEGGPPGFTPGTSFSSPKVMRAFVLLNYGLRLAAQELRDHLEGTLMDHLSPVMKLPLYGYVDGGPGDMSLMSPLEFCEQLQDDDEYIRITRTVNIDWIEAVISSIGPERAHSLADQSYLAAFRIFTRIATPLRNPDPDRVQYGIFSNDEVLRFLSSLTPAMFLEAFDAMPGDQEKQAADLENFSGAIWPEQFCQLLMTIYWTQERQIVAAIDY